MKQLRIIHLSDIHFGRNHRCSSPERGGAAGYPSLVALLERDLNGDAWNDEIWSPRDEVDSPLLLMITGDLTQGAATAEFEDARKFVDGLTGKAVMRRQIGKRNTFVVPGNHDVTYTDANSKGRFAPYCAFYSELFEDVRSPSLAHAAHELTQVHDRSSDGFIVAEINSCLYVQKDDERERNRGNVDMQAIARLRQQLESLPQPSLQASVRIALLHHHPVLFPALLEPERGYDAVVNSHYLLKLLRDFGFQLVLHGHKHYPHVLTYDPDSAWADHEAPAMLIVAGGSTASRELPLGGRACNTYSLIAVKWHPEAAMGRIRVVTRGLMTMDGAGELTPDQWQWITLRVTDRMLLQGAGGAERRRGSIVNRRTYWSADQDPGRDVAENARKQQYEETHLNMVMSEVLPSLRAGQAYSVRVWIAPHMDEIGNPKPGWLLPKRVRWTAGPNFDVVECDRKPSGAGAPGTAMFEAGFDYWAPMVVQAQMFFDDGTVAYGHTYAGFPGHQTWAITGR